MYLVNKEKKPIVESRSARMGPPRKYPFDKMDIGDSFDVSIRDLGKTRIQSKRVSLFAAAKNLGRKACVRLVDEDGRRCLRAWRVA